MAYDPIVRTISRLVMPFILLLAIYLQTHGELSPGGGFQAGVILATLYIYYMLIFGHKRTTVLFPNRWLRRGMAYGIWIYAGIGMVSIVKGGHYLEYNVLHAKPQIGQIMGIIGIEIGVGLAVASALSLTYHMLAVKEKD